MIKSFTRDQLKLKQSKSGKPVFSCQTSLYHQELLPLNLLMKLTSAKMPLLFHVYADEKKPQTKFISVAKLGNIAIRKKIRAAIDKGKRTVTVSYKLRITEKVVKFKLDFTGLKLVGGNRIIQSHIDQNLIRVVAISVDELSLNMVEMYHELLTFTNTNTNDVKRN